MMVIFSRYELPAVEGLEFYDQSDRVLSRSTRSQKTRLSPTISKTRLWAAPRFGIL